MPLFADVKTKDTPTAPSPRQKALNKLGLVRDIDFALHLPLRYEDETRLTPLAAARAGETVQIEAAVTACEVTYRPRRQLLVTVDDGTGVCTLRFFNFYPSQQAALAVSRRVRARGELQDGFLGLTMMHPAVKPAEGALPQALTPVYPTVAGLPQPFLRRAVLAGLARADLSDTLPPEILGKNGPQSAWGLDRVLSFLHQPEAGTAPAALEDRRHPAWQRLKAEELLAQQLSQLQAKRERAALRATVLQACPGGLHEKLLAALPFALTRAQTRAAQEIARSLARDTPMHRLLQGDVGSGKTVVAALAAALCIDAGHQCALMVPTEILARQHFGKLADWLAPLGVEVAWLAGAQKKKERDAMLARIASGQAGLVVGTHAVIQARVEFKSLALAVIDEQHRFGVAQRLSLRGKAGALPEATPDTVHDTVPDAACGVMEPHLLMMSATPIPRTLAMSYYADLDVSTLDELPPGRTTVVTKLIADSRRGEVVQRIRAQLALGRQVYWVCPLIEEGGADTPADAHAEGEAGPSRTRPPSRSQREAADLANATATHEALCAALPGVAVGLLHSRMPAAQKQAVMADFTAGHMGVLVATTVIEVGVDVPNASLMVIEHAERFGLSQLHQLRGRVGRGAAASACVLLYAVGESGRLGEGARARLKAMAETSDGFEIARRDLEIRGPGEFLGARQSGAPLLRFADLSEDAALLAWARAAAPRLLDGHPALAARHVTRWLGGKSDYLKA